MPSAKKNEKKKGTSVTAAPQRSRGAAKAVASARTPAKAASKSASTTKGNATTVGKSTAAPAKAVAKSAAKPASKTSAKPAAKAKAPAKSAAKSAKTAVSKTTDKKSAKTAAAKPAAKTPAAKPATAARPKTVAKAPVKPAAKTTKSTAVAEKAASAKVAAPTASKTVAPAKAPAAKAPMAQTPTAKEKPAAAKKAEQIPSTPVREVARGAAVQPPKATTTATPAPAPAPQKTVAQAVLRGAASVFPAAATAATAGKSSSTPTAGEDKKLAKKTETQAPTAAAVAAEKTATPEAKTAPKPAKPATPKHGFKLNEFIVYPAHGVGQIVGMETQVVAGFSLELFVVSFIKDKMILKVPTSKVTVVGMRKLAETTVVEKALTTLSGRARIKRTMWSRRAQEYEAKINSGDLVTIAEVVRDLYRSDTQPEQSYSERQLYEAALDRMSREVAAVRKLIDSESLKLIESFLQKGPRRGKAETEAVEEAETEEEDVDRAA